MTEILPHASEVRWSLYLLKFWFLLLVDYSGCFVVLLRYAFEHETFLEAGVLAADGISWSPFSGIALTETKPSYPKSYPLQKIIQCRSIKAQLLWVKVIELQTTEGHTNSQEPCGIDWAFWCDCVIVPLLPLVLLPLFPTGIESMTTISCTLIFIWGPVSWEPDIRKLEPQWAEEGDSNIGFWSKITCLL